MSDKEAEQEPTLKFTVPSPKERGFLKRQRRALVFAKKFNENRTDPESIDEMVEFLADFITVPETREGAIEALWDATQEQFEDMLDAISGVDAKPDPQSGGPSGNGS